MYADDLRDWDWIQANKSKKWPRLSCAQLASRARTSPSDPVIGCGDRMMDAEEFAHRIAGVAVRLLGEPGDRPVAVLVDRSIESAIGLMGVQWAGKCLVPLNVDDPTARLMSILDRIGDCTVVDATDRGVRALGLRSVTDLSEFSPDWIDPVAVRADSDGLVIFTSGSTGEPKGIVRTCWQDDSVLLRNRTHFADQIRSAVMSPLYWLGGLSTFRCTLGDGYMHIVDPMSMSASELITHLAHHQIEAIHGTPSLVESLGKSLGDDQRIDTLTRVRMFGEPVQWSTIAAARALGAGPVTTVAVYGASEMAGFAAFNFVGPDEPLGVGPLPLGQLAGDYVSLDPFEDRESGIFEVVARKWVSDRYWGDPDMTSRVFGIDDEGNPFYRTGDLVEVDARGDIWYVGRADDAVKIAGKLVNPSEAATVLTGCDGVRRAVVLPRALDSGRKSLVAHVAADADVDPDTLRSTLAEKLPSHLVPAVIMRHDDLPLLPGGKVDRQRLMQHPVKAWRKRLLIEPQGYLESIVVREAALLLGLDGLSADDDLWSLGLDSLGAVELCERLAQAMNPGLTVNDFIGAATPAAIARLLGRHSRAERSHIVQPVEGENPDVFIVCGGGAPALSYRELARRIERTGVVCYEQMGLMQRHRPDRSVRASAKRNLDHLRDVCTSQRPVLIGHSWGGLVAHEMAIELRRNGLDPLLVLLDTSLPSHHGKHSDRPAVLKVRVRPWPLYLARLFYWRFHRVLAPIWQRRRSDRRYLRLFRHAVRVAQRHDVGLFGGPILLVSAIDSPIGNDWTLEPDLRVVTVPGDHNSILQPPNVQETARCVMSFISEYSAAPTESREE